MIRLGSEPYPTCIYSSGTDRRTGRTELDGHTRLTHQRNKLHGPCLATAPGSVAGERVSHRQSRVQRRSPLELRGRLLELRRRARPRLPSATGTLPAQHASPHTRSRENQRQQRRQRLVDLPHEAMCHAVSW
eukprot:scaffold40942_cov68-Phaeocystis_antarctica.AAC.2